MSKAPIKIENEFQRFRQQLLDLGMRNPLISYRKSTRKTLQIVDELPEQVYVRIVGDNKSMKLIPDVSLDVEIEEPKPEPAEPESEAEPGAKAKRDKPKSLYSEALPDASMAGKFKRYTDDQLQTNLSTKMLQTVARKMDRDAKAAIDETGINLLYLAMGFLKWHEKEQGDDQARIAPLVLIPVEIVEKVNSRGSRDYFVTWNEDEVQTNACLRKKLELDFGLTLPDLAEDQQIEEYLIRVRDVISHRKSWSVEREMLLGFFSFYKLSMYADIDPANWSESGALDPNSLAAKLILGNPASDGRGSYAPDYEVDDHPIARGIELPLDADSSQLSAITDIAQGKDLVIEGPPGTGKSQTIANAIAHAIEQGKTVLFVAEKLAALEVVYRRLEKAGLAEFCLEIHGHSVAPKRVMESLRKRLEGEVETNRQSDDSRSRLERCKQKLRNYLLASAKRVGPFKEPLYDLFWRVVSLRQQGVTYRRELIDNPDVDRASFEEACEAIQAFALPTNGFENPQQSAFWGFFPTDLTPGEASRVAKSIEPLRHLAADIDANIEEIGSLLGQPTDSVRRSVENIDLDRLHELGKVPLDGPGISFRVFASEPFQERASAIQAVHDQIQTVRNSFEPSCFDSATGNFSMASELPLAVGDRIRALPQDLPILRFLEIRAWTEQTRNSLATIQAQSDEWMKFGLAKIDRLGEYQHAVETVRLLKHSVMAERSHLAADWFFEGTAAQILQAAKQSEELVKRKAELAAHFHMDSVPASESLLEILKVLRATGASWFRFFDSGYRAASRSLRQFTRASGLGGHQKTIAQLESLIEFQKDRLRFEKESPVAKLLGEPFQGIDTDWEQVKKVAAWAREAKSRGLDANIVNRLLPLREQLNQTHSIAEIKNNYKLFLEQFQSPNAALLGFDSTPIGHRKIGDLFDRLSDIQEVCPQIDRISDFLKNGKQTTIRDMVRICESGRKYRENVEWLNRVASSNDQNERTIAEAIRQQKLRVDLVTDWLGQLKAVGLSQEAIERLPESNPQKVCLDLVAKFRAIRENLNKWQELRTELAGKAELTDDWLSARTNGVVRANLAKVANGVHAELDRLPAWIAYCRTYQRCCRAGVEKVAREIRAGNIEKADARKIYELSLLELIAERELAQNEIGYSFTAQEIEDVRSSFQKFDREMMAAKALEISRKARGRPVPEGNAVGRVSDLTELSLVRHEIGKKIRHCRIRELIRRGGAAIQALKPCFLMSPLSLAMYLPSNSIRFDLVIMDEASQIKPEEAIGAILRAGQLVVVGDPKQLPPTTFFDNFGEEASDEEATQFDNAESVLEVAQRSFQPFRRLRWHYRSQHESLIQFSNHRFYDQDLIIFPSSHAASEGYGIHHNYVAEASCAKGENVREAQEVVKYIVDHALHTPHDSLGVAAFSLKQAEMIQTLLDKACADDKAVSEAIANMKAMKDELFIKNLESIQGDERDVIAISYTYGPDPISRRVMQRFGPINSDDGWRRLNVMVTRACKRMEIFTSMRALDIKGGPEKSRGVNAYRDFLEFVETGVLHDGGIETGRPPDSPFEEAVAKVVVDCGLEAVFQVGVAGYFIDIGVRRREGDRNFILGIECDGATYHSSRSARDRDRLKEEVVRARGWRIHRIWSTEWFLNQAQEEIKLRNALCEAMA